MRLNVIGVHRATAGYPNTLFRLQALRRSQVFDVTEFNVPFVIPRWSKRSSYLSLILAGSAFLWAHVAVLVRYVWVARRGIAYVPYPSPLLVWLTSFLPRARRPDRLVADVFLSLYDTVVGDRRLLGPDSLAARILFGLERRAYDAADVLIVDTPQNAIFLQRTFGVSADKTVAIPLATDEEHFRPSEYVPGDASCQVLFIGTLVPLQGIQTVLSAARILAGRSDIQLKLIGDGQEAPLVERALRENPSLLQWERSWQSSSALAREIRMADICLGIFGSGDKTRRVCPLKIYAYLSVGRAVITGDTHWTRYAASQGRGTVFLTVPVGDAEALAHMIVTLTESPEQRIALAVAGRRFYSDHLCNRIGEEMLQRTLLGK